MKVLMVLFIIIIALPVAAQGYYPDSAVVIGITHFGFGTGEASGNRVSVRDSQGYIHAVYCYAIGGPYADSGEVFYVYSIDNGLTWSAPENISQTDSATSTDPNIVIDSQDKLHCVWKQLYEDTSTTYYDYDLYYSQNTGSGWTSAINITNQGSGMNACYSSMVVDSRDYVHVVYDMSTGSGNWDIFYSFYNDTVWSVPYQISTSPYDDAFPALAIDQADNLHLVWRKRVTDGPIMYSYYDGISWSTPEAIASILGGQTYLPCIVVNSQAHPSVIFASGNLPSDSGEIYYTAFDGVAWSEPLNLSNTVNPSAYSSLAIDSLDNLYVVWVDGQHRDIYYRIYHAGIWADTINISDDAVGSYCPKLGNLVKGDKVDLVWVSFVSYPPYIYEVVYLGLNLTGIAEQRGQELKHSQLTIHPNPFNKITKISFCIEPGAKGIALKIYDASGRLIESINQGILPSDSHRIIWQAKNLPDGVYFMQLKGGGYSIIKKIIKIK